ncbi:hypothetical protein UlMin_020053, partial [Ulmus minor]
MNPHSNQSTSYSTWPIILVNYNLPPHLCMKRKFFMLTMLISGPKQPRNDIDVFLAPLVEDLKLPWEEGVECFDGYRNETFNLRATLLWTINDFPTYGNLSGYSVKGYKACPIWYVRNRSRPEGCIIECYVAEEAVEFCSEYLESAQTIGIPKMFRCKWVDNKTGVKVDEHGFTLVNLNKEGDSKVHQSRRMESVSGTSNVSREDEFQEKDTLTQKAVMGEFHPQGKKDTLSEALGSEEHRGRVRGLGKGYTWGKFWGSSATRGTIHISALFEQYKQEMNQSMQMLHDRLSRFEQTHSGRTSCDAPRSPVYRNEPVEFIFTPQPRRWSEELCLQHIMIFEDKNFPKSKDCSVTREYSKTALSLVISLKCLTGINLAPKKYINVILNGRPINPRNTQSPLSYWISLNHRLMITRLSFFTNKFIGIKNQF